MAIIMKDFVHLHVHSVFSLLDGAARIKELVRRAKELGQKAIAITDHGVMYGVVDFYKAAKEAGIKPILGCEVYISPRKHTDKAGEIDAKSAHLVLLAKNKAGYQNLMKIVSLGHLRGFYHKPRVDREILKEHSEGLIALSACLAGEIPMAILDGDMAKAKEVANEYIEIFGTENFFIEVQDHGIPEQIAANKGLRELASELGLGLVATNDVHYLERKDAEIQDILMCIQTGKVLNDTERMKFSGSDFYLKSGDEMAGLFADCDEAIANSVKIAEMCDVELEFGELHLPRFVAEDGRGSAEVLREICEAGARERYGKRFGEIAERLEFELATLEEMGFTDYFLIVQDFINYAKSKGISVGPGRGSAAGSIVSYCLGITDVEPIRYGLLFERFLNPERVSMPDIDIDFCYRRRHEVIEYVVQKYGKGNVAQIITFGTLGARAAIRDVGRVMDVPYGVVDRIAKLVPMELGITLKAALDKSRDFRAEYENDDMIRKLIDNAIALEGVPRHASTHAAGVVITERPMDEYVPLQLSDESVVTQFPMGTLEELGLLKMDFLGLRNLTVIQDTLDALDGVDFGDYDDAATFELISAGETNGVFQLESAGMKAFLRELKPSAFEDIIAAVALYRPGPMDSIPTYIKNKLNPSGVTYRHPSLAHILGVTYGCVVYQEQVMQIVRDLGGYTLGQADILRRAMGKKKKDVMEKERSRFIAGAGENGIDAKVAADIFGDMLSFASYAFNKSHAAAYAVIAYQTAYLKTHYPCEFMAALLCSEIDNTAKITKYIEDARAMGIAILPCSINESEANFAAVDGDIRFGLVAVKGVGEAVVRNILKERQENGVFRSFDDFCSRMSGYDVNKKAVEALIRCGAFGDIAKRSQLMAVFEDVLGKHSAAKKRNIEGQLSFFEMADASYSSATIETELPDVPEYPQKVLLAMERECTGIFMSGNPLDEYDEVISGFGVTAIDEILAVSEGATGTIRDGAKVSVAGTVIGVKKKATKGGAQMAFIDLQDKTGTIEVVVFPKTLMEHYDDVVQDSVICVRGRVSVREDVAPSMVCDEILPITKEAMSKVYIKISSEEIMPQLRKVLGVFRGKTPVYIYNDSTKKTMKAPRSLWVDYCDALVGEIETMGLEIKVKKP